MSSIFRASDVQLTPCSQGHLLASTQNITVVLEKQQNKFPDHQYCLALQGSWLDLHEEKFHIGAAWRQVSSWGKQCRCRQSETRAMTPHPALWLPRMTSYPAASGTYNTWASLLSGEMKTSVRTSKSKRWLCLFKACFPFFSLRKIFSLSLFTTFEHSNPKFRPKPSREKDKLVSYQLSSQTDRKDLACHFVVLKYQKLLLFYNHVYIWQKFGILYISKI